MSTGDTVKLSHVWTGLTLHSHDLPYTHPGTDGLQQVTCFGGSDDNDRWLLVGTAGTPAGTALRDGSVVRLRHVSTGRWLRSAPASRRRSRTSSRSAPSDTADASADWRVEVIDDRPWTAGARVRLVHVATGRRAALPPRLRPPADRRPAGGHRLPRSATSTTGGRCWSSAEPTSADPAPRRASARSAAHQRRAVVGPKDALNPPSTTTSSPVTVAVAVTTNGDSTNRNVST